MSDNKSYRIGRRPETYQSKWTDLRSEGGYSSNFSTSCTDIDDGDCVGVKLGRHCDRKIKAGDLLLAKITSYAGRRGKNRLWEY